MPNVAPELIFSRNEFYIRNYAQIKTIVVVLVLMFILLVGFCVRQTRILQPLPKYFPTTPDGKIIEDPPVSENNLLLSKQKVDSNGVILGMPEPSQSLSQLEPYGDNALVLYWANLAVSEMFDYDYVHYRAVIQEASKFFTPLGHQNFIDALIASKNLETVKARSAVVIPQITGDIKLLGTRMVEGHFVWDIQLPLQLTYASAQYPEPIIQKLLANMAIARVSVLLSPFYGLAIYRLNFQEIVDNNGG